MIILVCGDRNWNDFNTIDKFLSTLQKGTEIVEGDCRGADKICGYLARKRGFIVHAEPANWGIHGHKAGPIRNRMMLDKYHPKLVVAFHNNINKSKGTKSMLNFAQMYGIQILIISSDGTGQQTL